MNVFVALKGTHFLFLFPALIRKQHLHINAFDLLTIFVAVKPTFMEKQKIGY